MESKIINALLDERRGYVARGLGDRVKAVDEVLASLGHRIETATIEPEVERAAKPKARKRKR
jgi:hypothetical protein